jgi:hypothetical protein
MKGMEDDIARHLRLRSKKPRVSGRRMCYSPLIDLTLASDGGAVSTRKFKIGEAVHYTSGLYGAGSPRGVYQITQLLPPEGDDFQYKIKSAAEAHERVAKESQLNHAV